MNRTSLGPDDAGMTRLMRAAEVTATPFYLYDTEVFAARADLLRAALPAGDLYYSAKANPHPRLLAVAANLGCGLELASIGELNAMAAAGVDASTAILVGPAKSDELLATAVQRGVTTIVVESKRELQRLANMVERQHNHEVRIMLRLSLSGARGTLRMSGHQFGMGHSEVLACHELLRSRNGLRFTGYHSYLASQLLSAPDIAHNARLVLAAAAELQNLGYPAMHLDLGGGFGVAYTSTDTDLDLVALAELLADMQPAGTGPRMMFESGRFLAGPAGALVCRVLDVKTIDSRRFVLLDGGINASGLFGSSNTVRTLHHSVVRNGAVVTGGTPANICGPLCTPMDRLATGVPCPAEIDDFVIWWNMGAYGLTAAPVNFLSFLPPAEVLI